MVRNVSRECTELTENSDFDKRSSFWDRIYPNRFFCSTECSQRCNGDGEENEVHDDWYPARMSYDDELPIASIPHRCPETIKKPMELPRSPFSIPWADLDGARSDLDCCSRPRGYSAFCEDGEPKCLMNMATGSVGTDFKALPMPRFLSGLPTKAYLYKPELCDPIDIELHRALQALENEEASVLALYRVKAGRYEIDGRQVQIYWGEGDQVGRLLVCEDEVCGPSIADMPLATYIPLVANVAMDLQRPAVAGTNMTFYEPAASMLTKSTDGDRYRAMRIACTQAKLRGEG